jgi:hypothetical protein
MKTNTHSTSKDSTERLAGGFGNAAAVQGDAALLRRAVLACLLGEDLAYERGDTVKANISRLIPNVEPEIVRDMAIEARTVQKLRHVPLFVAVEMLKHKSHRPLVGDLLPQIIKRADELAEFLAIYWAGKRTPIAKQAKIGLAEAFHNFNEYNFAKYDRDEAVKLRDVMFMVHPKPRNAEEEALFKRIADRTLATPETWEVLYSAATTPDEKRKVWEKLIAEKKLGALAYVRNMRNMVNVNVPEALITQGLRDLNTGRLLPLNIITAAKHAPKFVRELEDLFFRSFEKAEKLAGKTILVVDVSGSMQCNISGKSENSRMDVAFALAVLAAEMCENIRIYATAGSDYERKHKTQLVPAYRGFGLLGALRDAKNKLGGGGIFTRQSLEYIQKAEQDADRIIVFSDSQDCDMDRTKLPNPFGQANYIVDVSSHKRGINYAGKWTAEISGWSEGFFDFILASEGLSLQEN